MIGSTDLRLLKRGKICNAIDCTSSKTFSNELEKTPRTTIKLLFDVFNCEDSSCSSKWMISKFRDLPAERSEICGETSR